MMPAQVSPSRKRVRPTSCSFWLERWLKEATSPAVIVAGLSFQTGRSLSSTMRRSPEVARIHPLQRLRLRIHSLRRVQQQLEELPPRLRLPRRDLRESLVQEREWIVMLRRLRLDERVEAPDVRAGVGHRRPLRFF